MKIKTLFVMVLLLVLAGHAGAQAQPLEVTDMVGRTVVIPAEPERIICLGPGALRLIVYLQAQAKVVGVEAMEKRRPVGRPYYMAQPQLGRLPVVGPGGPGAINKRPDLEAVLTAAPDLIFATYYDATLADQVTDALGIPVVVLSYGDLSVFDRAVYDSLLLAGRILDCQERARKVVDTIQSVRDELGRRTAEVAQKEKPGVFVGGIGFRGAHGIESTKADYIPLDWNNANNLARQVKSKIARHVFVDKEVLLGLNPDIIFIDGGGASLVAEDIGKKPDFYRSLKAFASGRVYTLLPFNYYTTNIGTAMANAWAIGKVLYPDRFADVDPAAKADEIYTFLVGRPVYEKMRAEYGALGAVARFDR